MAIHPIQSFKAMSTGKKVATVAGTLVGAGAIAATVAAGIKGGKTDAFLKLANAGEGEKQASFLKKLGVRFGEGYKEVGGDIAKFFTKTIPGLFHKAEKAEAQVPDVE